MKFSKRSRFFISPIIIGLLASIGPILFLPGLLILFVTLELFRTWRHGFMNDGPIRILMLAAIVLTAALLPTKYVDQKISLENFEVINGDNSSAIRVDSAYIWFPKGFDTANVEFGKGKTSISEMIDNIEQQTGLVHSIGYCGTGMNLLFGGSPIGGIRFSPDNERN